jgi:hypothetical protein
MNAHLYNVTPYAGPIDPAFLFADGKTLGGIERARSLFFGVGKAERHRLVEAAKSPTREKQGEIARNLWDVENHARRSREQWHPVPQRLDELQAGPAGALGERLTVGGVICSGAEVPAHLYRYDSGQDVSGVKRTVIQYRTWSQEYRIRTRTELLGRSALPDNSGARESTMLTDRGARKIADSCAYMAKTRGGFKTFVTGTFDETTRADIASGATTIQKEVTRTMDALSKMYRRGWLRKNGTEVEGHADALAYCWVVEVPKNADGADNPHVHMLIDWQVPYADFREWSQRIEAIWGNGYFHLEKIDDPECAGAYMAKAAGYLSKAAGQSDQGTVKGNRYAISKNARAPGWYTLGEYQFGIMGRVIAEIHERLAAKHAAVFAERARLREQRDAIRQRAKALQQAHPQKRYPLAARSALEKIGAALVAVRKRINAIPVRASKYQVILKTETAYNRFIGFAMAHGWKGEAPTDPRDLQNALRKIRSYKRMRSAWSLDQLADWIEQRREAIADAWQAFHHYENQPQGV